MRIQERKRRPWTVRAHLLTIVVAAACLLIVFGTINTIVGLREANEEAVERAGAEAARMADEIAASLSEATAGVSQTVAALSPTFEQPEGQCTLTSGAVGPFGTTEIHLLDPDGVVFCSSNEPAVGTSYASLDWARATGSSADASVSQPFMDPYAGDLVVSIAAPAAERSGTLALILPLDDLASGLRSANGAREELSITVIDPSDGRLLSTTEAAGRPGDPVGGTAFETREERGRDLDGGERLYGWESVEGPGWAIAAGEDASVAAAGAREELWRRVISGIVLLCFLIGLVIMLNRRLVRPLETLTEGIRKAGVDPSPTPVSVDGPAEVVGLATEFNSMVQARTEYEERLIHSQKMEAVGQLAGGIAHDFNNLLAAIGGYGHLLMDSLKDDPRQRDVQEIVRAADRGAALTRRLLTFSRRETSSPKVLDLHRVAVELEGLLRQVIREDVRVAFDISPDCRRVFIDPVEFDQIVVNLAVNARDAMPSGGTIAVSARNQRADEKFERPAGGGGVVLSISDTGTGIPEEMRNRIFEPFFTTKEKGKGTGLGLAVVYGLVEKAGGTIEVASVLGEGATFSVVLPAATGSPEPGRPGDAKQKGSGRKILFVEDEEMVRRATVRILEQYDYDVVVADSGAEALRMLESGLQVDLLLTDLIMPNMSGTELAQRAGLPVLYLSGYSDSVLVDARDKISGIAPDPRSSVRGHLIEKPFDPQDLVAAIERTLDPDRG